MHSYSRTLSSIHLSQMGIRVVESPSCVLPTDVVKAISGTLACVYMKLAPRLAENSPLPACFRFSDLFQASTFSIHLSFLPSLHSPNSRKDPASIRTLRVAHCGVGRAPGADAQPFGVPVSPIVGTSPISTHGRPRHVRVSVPQARGIHCMHMNDSDSFYLGLFYDR